MQFLMMHTWFGFGADWRSGANFLGKQYGLYYVIATYKKIQVTSINNLYDLFSQNKIIDIP